MSTSIRSSLSSRNLSLRAVGQILALLILGLGVSSCGYSQRTGDAGRSPDDVSSMLDEIAGTQTTSTVSGDVTTAMQYRSTAKIYFGDAPGSLGPVGSLLSLTDFSFLGSDGTNLGYKSISNARVFLLDHPSDGGSGSGAGDDLGLVIGINTGSGLTYYGFNGTAQVSGNVLEADMTGGGQTISIQTTDVSGNSLNNVIQLKIYSNGAYIGKISTLVGYTN